ncbi:MAG TPA: hypothetical protein VFR70_09990 [Flavobacterium sp.]|nr:hypothetical protein [Flavobacterium sp.]
MAINAIDHVETLNNFERMASAALAVHFPAAIPSPEEFGSFSLASGLEDNLSAGL